MRASYQEAMALLNAAQAQSKLAIADERRIKALYGKKVISQQSYDTAETRVNTISAATRRAKSAVKQIKVNLNDHVLHAPFDGVISERLHESGDMCLPGIAIVILQKDNDLRLEAAIPTSCAKKITLGMQVNIRVDSLKKEISGTIDEIVPEIDPLTGTQLIKASLPSPQ